MSAADAQIYKGSKKNEAVNIPIMIARQSQNKGIIITASYSTTWPR